MRKRDPAQAQAPILAPNGIVLGKMLPNVLDVCVNLWVVWGEGCRLGEQLRRMWGVGVGVGTGENKDADNSRARLGVGGWGENTHQMQALLQSLI